jgi:hypothetical protein
VPDGGSVSDDRNPMGPFILFQCASHTLSLLIKEFTKACSWVSKVYVDSVAISTVIATFCETRFGSNHLVLRSVLKVICPLRTMCAMDELEELARKNSAARRVLDTI